MRIITVFYLITSICVEQIVWKCFKVEQSWSDETDTLDECKVGFWTKESSKFLNVNQNFMYLFIALFFYINVLNFLLWSNRLFIFHFIRLFAKMSLFIAHRWRNVLHFVNSIYTFIAFMPISKPIHFNFRPTILFMADDITLCVFLNK